MGMKRGWIFLSIFAAMIGFSGMANATLWDRGGGLIYDDVLDITWLQDANLPYTETFGQPTWNGSFGILSSGMINVWNDAISYIRAMNDSNYLGYNTWRLPDAHNQDGSGPTFGYAPNSELGHMFYNNLNATLGDAVPGKWLALRDPTFIDGFDNEVSFLNLYPGVYWTGTENLASINFDYYYTQVWGFDFVGSGSQGYYYKINLNTYPPGFVWAVLDGDVAAPVPEPTTMLLLASGLAGLAGFRRFRKA